MTAPTRERVHEWAEKTQLSHFACYVIPGFFHRLQRFAALAFAAGQSCGAAPTWTEGAPPKPWSGEWFIAETTYGDRVVLTELPDEYAYDFKTADDTYLMADKVARWMQFPDSEYKAFSAPSGSGAELVREVESVGWHGAVCPHWWPRLRAALLSGDAAREDAERLDWLEDMHTLHTSVEALYVVDGYEVTVLRKDGREKAMYHGTTLRKAIDRARGREVMRDVLTEEEVSALIYAQSNMSTPGWRASLQAAARIGAERERERAARVCEAISRARHARGLHSGYNAIMECVEAIRRGEGE